jgi:acetolactate synthase-1/2/3 large subunit
MMRPQLAFFPDKPPVATQLNYTRYDKIVEAMGGHGEYVTRPEEIRPALERAFAAGIPACINVEIERDLTFGGGIYV